MKKSEMIEKLNSINGDSEVVFAVSQDCYNDDWSFTFIETRPNISLEKLYQDDEEVLFDHQIDDHLECKLDDPDIPESELLALLEKTKTEMFKGEKIVITIDV